MPNFNKRVLEVIQPELEEIRGLFAATVDVRRDDIAPFDPSCCEEILQKLEDIERKIDDCCRKQGDPDHQPEDDQEGEKWWKKIPDILDTLKELYDQYRKFRDELNKKVDSLPDEFNQYPLPENHKIPNLPGQSVPDFEIPSPTVPAVPVIPVAPSPLILPASLVENETPDIQRYARRELERNVLTELRSHNISDDVRVDVKDSHASDSLTFAFDSSERLIIEEETPDINGFKLQQFKRQVIDELHTCCAKMAKSMARCHGMLVTIHGMIDDPEAFDYERIEEIVSKVKVEVDYTRIAEIMGKTSQEVPQIRIPEPPTVCPSKDEILSAIRRYS